MITRDTFDKNFHSLGTGKAPGPDGIPNEIMIFLPPTAHSALYSLLYLLAHNSYKPPRGAIALLAYCTKYMTNLSLKAIARLSE
jgi:hypothetical protein